MNSSTIFQSAVLVLAMTAGVPMAHAESNAKADTVRPEIGKPLQEAAELVKTKQFSEALAKIKSTDAVADRTPFENLTIDRMRGAAAAGAGQLEVAVEAFQRVIDSARLTSAEQLQLVEGIAASYFKAENYPKAVVWAQRYFKDGGTSENIRNLLLQSQYQSGDYAAVVSSLKSQNAADVQAGRTPPEISLQLLADSSLKMKDMAGYTAALEMLVQKYPKPTYWTALIAQVSRQPGFSDRHVIDVLRLQRATATLTNAADYLLLAELAMQANLPAEALAVLEEGYTAKLLDSGPQSARAEKLRSQTRTLAAGDLKVLPDSEITARKASTGVALVNVGTNYLGQKQYQKAATLIQEGIAKGGLKRPEEAQLHLGIALQLAGDKPAAATALKAVQGKDGAADLARIWSYAA